MLGPGLIGGSLLKAVRKYSPSIELRAWARREEAVEELRASGSADFASTGIAEVVAGADLAILCMPVGAMADAVSDFPEASPGERLLVTDVGSVKQSVVNSVESIVQKKGGSFIGSHPMAGSEKSGMEFAEAELFQEAPVILTPGNSDGETLSQVSALTDFWESLGSRVSRMSPPEHDELVASVSHLPHVVAAVLVNTILGARSNAGQYAGGGFRDTTRIAGGHAGMWTGILMENREAVLGQLNAFSSELEKWKEAIGKLDTDELRSFLTRASSLREDS